MRLALQLTLALLAALVLAVGSLPVWLGTALRPAAARFGVTFERYERVGYARFALTGVRYTRPGLTATARRAELDTPLLWLLRRSSAHGDLAGWSLQLTPTPREPSPPHAQTSPAEVHAQVRSATAQLRAWLPRFTASEGQVAVAGRIWPVAALEWAAGTLTVAAATPTQQSFQATLREVAGQFTVRAESAALAARADLAWSGAALEGAGAWHAQPLTLRAQFGAHGWIPLDAELRAENWELAAAQVPLPAGFDRLRGGAALVWREDAFTLEARAHGTPSRADLPALDLALQARGDRTQVTLGTLHLQAPFGTAQLSAPLQLLFDGRAPARPARLAVALDLAQQPWIPARGRLAGELHVAPQLGQSRGNFALRIADFHWRELHATEIALTGDWTWPRFRLTRAEATLDAESRVAASGEIDWSRRELHDVQVDGTLTRAAVAAFLPEGVTFERIAVRGRVEGPLESPRHQGELEASGVRAGPSRAIALTARWQGLARTLPDFAVTAQAGDAALRIAGSLEPERATLSRLTWEESGRTRLASVAPAEITWQPVARIAGLRLEGGESALAIDAELGAAPTFFVSAQALSSAWLTPWLEKSLPAAHVYALTARGAQHDGFWSAALNAEVAATVEGAELRAKAAITADGERVLLDQLELADARGLMAYASGRLPVRLAGGPPLRAVWDDSAPLEFDLSIAPDSPLWEFVRERTGVAVEHAGLVASARGTLADPQGILRLEAARIHPGPVAQGYEAQFTDLQATLLARADGLRLDSASVLVNGQPILASARVPLSRATWPRFLSRPQEFPWAQAEAEIRAERLPISALARTFPALPLTQGEVEARLALASGELTGRITLRDGASRPLPGFGRLLDLDADLALAGRRCEVRRFSGTLGGEPVELSGFAELADARQLRLDLRLQARNVPLVRRPGLLVRTDLDLLARTPDEGPTRLSGTVELRDALVMADLATILPGGPRGTARTPPYFSVDAEPFSKWPVDVRLTGHRAVRVRTAVFSGVATPQFLLTGTLGDPRAIGQLTLDGGQAIFPFARFDVQQGTVRLTEADPTQPQLALQATSKRLGYELRLEVGGTTAAPTMTFSSNPPLDSAEILLLVTAGQPPKEETEAPTGTQRLTRLGTFLGRGLFQNFGDGEERLEITSGEQVSESGRETYRVEYKLREKLSLTGEYDRYDDYNAGLKYRLYTQEGTKREPKP